MRRGATTGGPFYSANEWGGNCPPDPLSLTPLHYTEELGMPERQIVRFSTRKLSLVEIWRESLNLLRLRDFAARGAHRTK